VFADTSVGIGSFGTTGSTFTNFVLQPGIYQVHLSIDEALSPVANAIYMWLNYSTQVGSWYIPLSNLYVTVNIGGDRLFAVASANTALSFQVGGQLDIGQVNCTLIITQLQ
jgi:hypothetical protein